tara:strand:- start:350 stop:727 length:378 start_codon:yes stop_codon:yes gene_type:complete
MSEGQLSKPHYKEWVVNHQNHEIKVTSSFTWGGTFSGELFVDRHSVDKVEVIQVNEENAEEILAMLNPKTPILSAEAISERINFIGIYAGGAFTRKISIMYNDENIYQDNLNFIDKLVLRLLSKR